MTCQAVTLHAVFAGVLCHVKELHLGNALLLYAIVTAAYPSNFLLYSVLALACYVECCLQVSGPTPEFESAKTAVARISLDPKIKQEVLAASNLAELYQQAGTSRKQGQQGSKGGAAAASSLAAAASSSAAAAFQAAAGQLTYQRLAASAPMQKATTVVVQQLLRYMELFYKRTSGSQQHSFEVAVLLDNSGSMSRLADETKQALVLLAEVLRRLEVKFAVVRFGRAHGQKVLKGLGDPFSAQAMQLALEAMTFDEGTYPASACDFVAREVFKGAVHASPSSSQIAAAAAAGTHEGSGPEVVHHRLVLALVDGLTQEMRAEVRLRQCCAIWGLHAGSMLVSACMQHNGSV
jgi:hypothetical protein